jgi:hypothetical protein
VASANVGRGGVASDSLEGAGNRSGGDVGGTEVVHVGGIGPVCVDAFAVRPHTLSGGAHVIGHGGVGVSQPGLVAAARQVGGSEREPVGVTRGGVEAHAARVGAYAGVQLLEVMDGVEHFSASIERVRINTRTELLNL